MVEMFKRNYEYYLNFISFMFQEAIVGKCNVVCTAKDRRNTLLSKSDLAKTNYYVSYILDVGDLRISDKFPDIIDKIKG